jgi:Tol biopolymer transport system component
VSPDGERVAVIESTGAGQGSVALVDKSGAVTRRSGKGNIAPGAAWTPDGREVWFNGSETGLDFAVHAMALDGRERVIHRSMGTAAIFDIARDGRALMVHERVRAGMTGIGPDEARERDLSWLDFSVPRDLSSDGKVVLFTESGVGAGSTPGVFMRPTDGSPAVRLGDGIGLALSPDGRWALVARPEQGQLVLLPTGAGQARVLETGKLTTFLNGRWLPDGTHVIFNAREPGRQPRVYLLSVTSGGPAPLTPEGVQSRGGSVTPDAKLVLASGPGRPFWLYPLAGGPPFPAKGFAAGDTPIRWSGDGKSMWTVNQTSGVPQIMRVDVTTGRREVWREITNADPGGLIPNSLRVVISADGKSYVYGYNRALADLYVAEGLR